MPDYERSKGSRSMGNYELVAELKQQGFDSGNASKSIKNLEAKGLVTVGRTWRGKAENVVLTATAKKLTKNLP